MLYIDGLMLLYQQTLFVFFSGRNPVHLTVGEEALTLLTSIQQSEQKNIDDKLADVSYRLERKF
jgi:hypothetical protein